MGAPPVKKRRLSPDDARYWYSQCVMNHRAGKPRYDGMTDEQKQMALEVQRERRKISAIRRAEERRPEPPPGMPPYLPKVPAT